MQVDNVKKRRNSAIGLSDGEPVYFTIASALLRELGERLVGKPHIALAELVKNSYDADANDVIIRFEDDFIQIVDNGHGMNEDEFRRFWMRIGSPHKQDLRVSRNFERPLTGSKGVGRLAVQFLARFIEIRSTSELTPHTEIIATVDWDEAVAAADLIKATALLRKVKPTTVYPEGRKTGTQITLRGLNQVWIRDMFEELAREVWSLQPPFKSNLGLDEDRRRNFSISLETPVEDYVNSFETQMSSALNQWEARIMGRLKTSRSATLKRAKDPFIDVIIEFNNKGEISRYRKTFQVDSSLVNQVQFEIRVFRLSNKMKQGVIVKEARDYFTDYGGVHIYDAGFHLPYYGPDTDWLQVERDHARRLTQSKLLPIEMQKSVAKGLNFLPSQRRLFGVVHINTNQEQQTAIDRRLQEEANKRGRPLTSKQANDLRREIEKSSQHLKVQVTRDRLVVNEGYEQLSRIVRTTLDYYAIVAQERNQEELAKTKKVSSAAEELDQFEQVLESIRDEMPKPVFMQLRKQLKAVGKASEREGQVTDARYGMLGALATAGISALAYDHELNRQMNLLSGMAEQLQAVTIREDAAKQQVEEIAQRLNEWVQRVRETRKLYSHLMTEENREERARFKVMTLIRDVENQVRFFLRGVPVEYVDVDEKLRLPEGSFAEWSSIFQNILINAFNAMLDSEERLIRVSTRSVGNRRMIDVQDTGCGVDLETADELFEPFERRLELSNDRRNLGLGGTGLGLTIVRMIADKLQCRVRFVTPSDGFNTAFQIFWRENR